MATSLLITLTSDCTDKYITDCIKIAKQSNVPIHAFTPDFDNDERECWDIPEAKNLFTRFVLLGGLAHMSKFPDSKDSMDEIYGLTTTIRKTKRRDGNYNLICDKNEAERLLRLSFEAYNAL